VANHASAEKRNRQRIKRTTRNRAVKSSVRTLVKHVHEAVTQKNKDGAKKALTTAIKALDKAASKGVMHVKAASRTVSRLSSAVHKLA
jgi:small subunit ribosomal protein S20